SIWTKMFFVLILFIATVITNMWLFMTNSYLLSRSFLATPRWFEQWEAAINACIEQLPITLFLAPFVELVKVLEWIDFSQWFAGVEVTCVGAQAPGVFLMDLVIILATVFIIDSQFHTVLALAFAPMTTLLRD